MSSERELDEGIQSIKSAWRREHTARTNLEKMLENASAENASAENAKLRELAAILCHCMQIKASCDDCRISGHKGELARDPLCACDGLHEMLRELGVEV